MRSLWLLASRRHAALTDSERGVIEAAVIREHPFEAHRVVVRAGEPLEVSLLLIEGVMSRRVDGRDGTRQLVGIQFAGDFVDLHGYPLKRLDHDVATITSARLGVVPHAALHRIQHELPDLARKLWFLTLLDASMHRQWVHRNGCLRAVQRIAHFLCESNLRLMAIGQSDGRRFTLALTQFDLAEVCGLTPVHVNRVLRELRELGLCTMRASVVEIHDLQGLMALAQFDPAYLYFDDELLKRLVQAAASPP